MKERISMLFIEKGKINVLDVFPAPAGMNPLGG
jgi:hypothetical protein